jgi:tripartite-type tricarboxylate transporter receptor subunit TctC
MNRRLALLALAAACTIAGASAPLTAAFAQGAYPTRPIRLVVPFPPGGPTDIYARQYANRIGAILGQNVIVENKAGASGAIGAVEVMRAPADGYTLLFGTASTHALYNLIAEKPQYDSLKDFAAVAILGGAPIVMVANPAIPPTLKGALDEARANPGKLSYASPGQGTMMHLFAERLKKEAGNVDIKHIPYKGTGQARPALLGGQVELMTDTLGASLPDHRAGKAKILAIAAPRRSDAASDVPTVDEALGTKGFEAVLWNAVFAPAGTPLPVLETLAAATAKALADPSLREQLDKLGITPELGSTPSTANAYIRAEMARWKPVIEALGVKLTD